ncbi:MAG: CHAD domain-containing protein [Bacteroidales bacterium]
MDHPVYKKDMALKENLMVCITYYHRSIAAYALRQTHLHENIHEIRLCFKRLRSILRLFRPALSHSDYRRWNEFYRDLSRCLSQMRDQTACIEVVTDLLKGRRSPQSQRMLSGYRSLLVQRRKVYFQEDHPRQVFETIVTALKKQEDLLPLMQIEGEAQQVFSKGLVRVYKQARKLYSRCLLQKNDHDLHQWRKQIKYLWYQLVYLTPLWPGMIRAWAAEFQSLSKLLGNQHDRVIMVALLLGEKEWVARNRRASQNTIQSLRLQSKKLTHKALVAGSRLFEPNHSLENFIWINL